MTPRAQLLSIATASCIAVAACGGDGASSSPSTTPASVASTTSAAAEASAPISVEGTSEGAEELDGPVDIGDGRELYVHCTGQGEPTVILESGYHDSSTLWSESEPNPPAVGPSVQERISEHVRVCSYDRPGTIVYGSELSLTDQSTPVEQPRLASDAVADLHALIDAAALPTPVVIVGHSMGGLLARLYAQTYPDEVSGLVFVDPFRIEMREAMGRPVAALRGAAGDARHDLRRDTAQDIVDLGADVPHVIATNSDHYVQVRQPDLVADSALVVIGRAARS